jgi:putative transcriptional regulator
MTQSLTGHLLVASSLVTDPTYAGGVCLIMHQDEEHTIGVMLNRPLRPTPEALKAVFGDKATRPNRLSPQHLSSDDDSQTDANASELEQSQGSAGLAVPGTGPGQVSPWRMIHFGGPLSGPVLAIHQESQFAEAETGSGIYLAAQKQHLEHLFRQESMPYRLIVGHLGWQTEQIENEIDSGIWHILPATVESVFSPAADMWPQLIRRATSNSLAKWIGVPDHVGACELN